MASLVELSPAYVWDCPDCGRENFQRAVSVRLNPGDPDDAAQIRDLHDLDPDEPVPDILSVTWQTRPERVTCRHCAAEFKAADVGTADDAGAD